MEVVSNTKFISAGTAQYIIDGNDGIINVDTSGGPVTIILPNIYNAGFAGTGRGFIINDYTGNAGTNNITIGAVNNTVNGDATVLIDSDGGSAKASIADLNEWFVSVEPVSGGSVPTVFYFEKTYAQAAALIASSGLTKGGSYKITDRADLGIILLAVSTNQFSLEGSGIFLNPDFQDTVLPGLLKQFDGVWDASLSVLVAGSSVVAWNGLQYVNLTGSNGASNPSIDTTNWSVLTKAAAANNYVQEVDFIQYKFTEDSIISRMDKRGNIIDNSPSDFQWGNDSVTFNFVESGSVASIINQKGTIQKNSILSNGQLSADNSFTGTLTNNEITGTIISVDSTSVTISYCIFSSVSGTSILVSGSHSYKKLEPGFSNFTADISMADAGIFSAGVLTLPTTYNYVGIFNLTGNTGQTISKIVNLSTTYEITFVVANGNTQIFSHTAIGSAVTDNLVSDTATTNTITGRTNGGDYISYKRAGTLNERTNIVILA